MKKYGVFTKLWLIILDEIRKVLKIQIKCKKVESCLQKYGSRVLELDKNISKIRLWLGKTHIKNERN